MQETTTWIQSYGNHPRKSILLCCTIEIEEGETPKFASLYVHDPTFQDSAQKNNLYLPKDTPRSEQKICEDVLIERQNELTEHNPYIHDIIQMCQIPDQELQEASFVITEKERPSNTGTRHLHQP